MNAHQLAELKGDLKEQMTKGASAKEREVARKARSAIDELESRIAQLEAPARAVIDAADSFDGVDTVALINAMIKRSDGQRKHIATLEQKLKVLAATDKAPADLVVATDNSSALGE
jgi:hypothetical protein